MKKASLFRRAVLAVALAVVPFCLPAKEAHKAEYTVKDCTMPDGTVTDLNLFKNYEKFKKDRSVNLANINRYKNLRSLTTEERLAWKEHKTPVDSEDYFLKQYAESETDLLGTMKQKKALYGSSFTMDGDKLRVIYVTADKKYTALSYERFYMVEREEDEMSGYTVENVTLPDKTVTDLIMFTSSAEYEEFSKGWLSKGLHGGRWASVASPTPREFKKIYDPDGAISLPGYIARHYSQAKLGELGKLMQEKQFLVAAYSKETGDTKRQIILIEAFKGSYDLFLYRKMDYVWEDSDSRKK